jgi:hypothetical protein
MRGPGVSQIAFSFSQFGIQRSTEGWIPAPEDASISHSDFAIWAALNAGEGCKIALRTTLTMPLVQSYCFPLRVDSQSAMSLGGAL